MKLDGRNAIITGANQGLGKEIARHFLREGANVALCARDGALLDTAREEFVRDIRTGQKVVAKTCDVSSEADVNALARFAIEEFGSIDVLVNNAGVYGPKGPTESVDLTAWMRSIEINLYGVLLPCRALIPHFKANGYGKIVILSGGGATNPLPFISSYAASKAAVVRLMETLAEELRLDGIDVNAIAPGALNTRLLDETIEAGPDKVGKAFFERALKQRDSGGVPLEKGASLCVYLASAQSDGITGKLISAQWDPWPTLHERAEELKSDIYTLRRIVPEDRGKNWA